MKTFRSKTVVSAGVALLALGIPLASRAQNMGQGQQNPPKPPSQQAPLPAQPAQPAINPEEEAAYKALTAAKPDDAPQQIQLGEDFLKKFPDSHYRQFVYFRLAVAYLTAGQEDKMFVAGEKAIELNPQDVAALALMANVMPRRVNPNSLDGDQRLQRAEKYGKDAIALLETMQKPAEMTEEEFSRAKNDKLSMCHSGLGLVYFRRQKFADSAAELEQATKLAPTPDPVDFYILGMAYQQAKRYGDAVTAFGRCSEAGPMRGPCKQGMEQNKKLAPNELAPPKP